MGGVRLPGVSLRDPPKGLLELIGDVSHYHSHWCSFVGNLFWIVVPLTILKSIFCYSPFPYSPVSRWREVSTNAEIRGFIVIGFSNWSEFSH